MLRRFLLLTVLPWIAYCQQTAIKPTSTIRLFDGKTLENFDFWQQDNHEKDPDRVFTVIDQVDGAPAIRISGEHWGGIITKSAYRDYRLIVEFRWGLLTWGQRKDKARDSGILLHCQGRPGSSQKDFNGPWMRSVEFQIIDGGVGDILVVGGYAENGEMLRPTLKAKTRKDRDGETVFDPNGQPNTYSTGRINWWGRSEDWVDRLGFRGPADVESKAGEWNHLEAIVQDGNLKYFVNGRLVNEGFEGSLTEGKLLFQSEGAELFFRRIELQPLP
jgi:hypothetical protein